MPNGTVKWFNANKGYGFIEPEGGAKDVFVHISAVEAAGMNTLNDGAKISFDLETGKNGKEAAVNIQPLLLKFESIIKVSKNKSILSLNSQESIIFWDNSPIENEER